MTAPRRNTNFPLPPPRRIATSFIPASGCSVGEEAKPFELLELGHLLKARVGDFGATQVKEGELSHLGHLLEASIGDLGVIQV